MIIKNFLGVDCWVINVYQTMTRLLRGWVRKQQNKKIHYYTVPEKLDRWDEYMYMLYIFILYIKFGLSDVWNYFVDLRTGHFEENCILVRKLFCKIIQSSKDRPFVGRYA